MDEGALTSQAIAELMRDTQEQNGTATTSHAQQERKINPLGKPNKRFLGRTISTVLRHNKRETERTQASCKQKLQELDDREQRRKVNAYYNGGNGERNSRSRSKRKKQRQYSSSERSGSASSERHDRSRSRKKKRKKKKKSKHRRRSKSYEAKAAATADKEQTSSSAVHDYYAQHSEKMALAVAMAYNQAYHARAARAGAAAGGQTNGASPASTTGDIVQELMSDGDHEGKIVTLSIASSTDGEFADEVLTIDVSTEDSASDSSDSESDNPGSSIALDDSAVEPPPSSAFNESDLMLGDAAVATIDLTAD